MLSVTQLSKRFGAKVLFDGLEWQLGRGEKVGLIGDNGTGKTTFLKLLAGEMAADGGTVHLSQGERIGYLPQEMPRSEHGTIEQRVATGDARLLAAQSALERATAALTEAGPEVDTETMMARAEELADAQQACDQLGAADYAGRIEQALMGLGFARERFTAPLTSLSGGWAMRVELARLLVAAPDYLLLDEPTNHLDQVSLDWLGQFLRAYRGSWVIVSHDHDFLNDTILRVAVLTDGKLVSVSGNVEAYAAFAASTRLEQLARGKKVAQKSAHLESFITRFGAKASKAKQAQSKAKELAKLQREVVAVAPVKKGIRVAMKVQSQSGHAVLRANDLHFGYGNKPLFTGASLSLDRGERLAIVGENGAGKSTLLKLLAKDLAPDAGTVVHGDYVEPFVFSQHQADSLDMKATVLELMRAAMPGRNDSAVRSALAALLFDAKAMDRKVAALSGGEKSRLALAKMVATPANLLLLDEPTNHLDPASRGALAAALATYNGTMVLISHDHELVESLATRYLTISDAGQLESHWGPPTAQKKTIEEQELAAKQAQGHRGLAPEAGSKQARQAEKARATAARLQQKQVADLEARIERAEQRLAAIDQSLATAEVFADVGKSSALFAERKTLSEEKLPELLQAWEQAAALSCTAR